MEPEGGVEFGEQVRGHTADLAADPVKGDGADLLGLCLGVIYFLGFKHPAAGARISSSARSVPVSFRIGSYNGRPVTASHASNLLLKVTLSRASNGSRPVTHAACHYSKTARAFQCTLRLPRNIATGPYFLTAYQQTGFGYLPCPKGQARSDRNTEKIYIRPGTDGHVLDHVVVSERSP